MIFREKAIIPCRGLGLWDMTAKLWMAWPYRNIERQVWRGILVGLEVGFLRVILL